MKPVWTIGGLFAVFAVIFGMYEVADRTGFKIDRPAWQSSVQSVRDYTFKVAGYALGPAAEELQAELNEINADIKALKEKGAKPRDLKYLMRQRKRVREELRNITKLLKK